MTFLAPPSRVASLGVMRRRLVRRAPDTTAGDPSHGARVFGDVGCAGCHVRSLTTGPSDVAALAARSFRPYSDFLLHDMGTLGDGIVQGDAGGREMRTAPLWGLHVATTLLHDGRATTIEDAIAAHDGQGRGARDRFLALPERDRASLVAFLRTL
jgi:CxxC motif-containing protein (DUF1111 family)